MMAVTSDVRVSWLGSTFFSGLLGENVCLDSLDSWRW
jgi:hypothetical protein